MRTLHVAAMPYPSHQGTQALIHQMLSALADAGHETHLLCYAHGAFSRRASYAVHRISARLPGRSLRSGPAPEKLALDAALAWALAERSAALRPDAVIAHHVEAALAAAAARAAPFAFVAHTSLASELPSYFPAPCAAPLARLGRALDRFACGRAARTLAVSPLLARLLRAHGASRVFPLSVPWPLSAPLDAAERARARAALCLSPGAEVVLYAGNLDAYQGLAPLVAGLERLARARPALRLLLATESDARALLRSLRGGALHARVQRARLGGEAERRALHAAADVVVVPRASAGGIPVKLLDALARGRPVIAARRALAGLPLGAACALVDGHVAESWQAALAAHFSQPSRELSDSGARALLARGQPPERFVGELVRHVHALARRDPEALCEARAASDIVPAGSDLCDGDARS